MERGELTSEEKLRLNQGDLDNIAAGAHILSLSNNNLYCPGLSSNRLLGSPNLTIPQHFPTDN